MPSSLPMIPDWSFPAGFDVPVHGLKVTEWPDAELPNLAPMERWRERPDKLRTIGELETGKLRPRNLLVPDALLIRRGVEITHEGQPLMSYDCQPLYHLDDTRPKSNLPTDEDVTADYDDTIVWARDILRSPSTVILTINTVGTLKEAAAGELGLRPCVCQIAVMSVTGRMLVNTPVDPLWGGYTGRRLSSYGLTRRTMEDAGPFDEAFFQKVLPSIVGRRVICLDRATTFATLFCDLEYAEVPGAPLPAGVMHAKHGQILDILGRSQWECMRLRASLHQRGWDAYRRRPLLTDINDLLDGATSPHSAENTARAVLDRLKQIAKTPTGQLVRPVLRNRADYARTMVGRPVRDPVMRARAIERSKYKTGQARCENPRCRDIGYLEDVTPGGEPLLEVDHIIGFAEYGIDDITNMIALCSNCHTRKTRGSKSEELAELFAEYVASLYR
ncbi:HNH endonuclease signature motif containing protein [Spirillospora sp. NBC_01491]|uniref:HNH endonuclease signature motif containing protein n=1 Tax=Spirillospora sp. NBC_01491 TaxID=2976007 RepID=UPI002E37BBD0|nr:HNH endonuclease signature motif containing protein [Spirillospora sp. NBC_01491]